MKKKIIRISIFFLLTALTTVGSKVVNNDNISMTNLMFSNIEALASSSEGESESGRSLCYSDCIKSAQAQYLPCGTCVMTDGIGNKRGGYCKW